VPASSEGTPHTSFLLIFYRKSVREWRRNRINCAIDLEICPELAVTSDKLNRLVSLSIVIV
jgi:hypothetical protein